MNRIRLAAWLMARTRSLLPPLVVSVLARTAGQLLGVALLVIAAQAIGRAATGAPVSVSVLVAWLVGVALVKAGLRYLEHYTGHWVAFTALQRLRELFYARLVPQAPAATTGRAGAELTARATRDIDRIEVFFAHTLPPAISAVLVPAIALSWLTATGNGLLAGVIAPFILFMLLVPVWSSGASWRAAGRVAETRGQLSAHLGDDVQGLREVLAFDAGTRRLNELDQISGALTAARGAAVRIQGERTATIVLLQLFALIAPVAVAAGTGTSPGQTLTALAVAVTLWVPARGIESFSSGLDAAFAATGRLREIMDAPPAVSSPASPTAPPSGSDIALEGVTVRYPGSDQDVLQEVTTRFEHGAWNVVVGASGSGKSTLAALLVRGLDPRGGTVRLGGIDVRELRLDELRGKVALVSQHPTVLSGTVGDNLRLGAPDADEEALQAALGIVALDEWARGLPQGLSTPMQERGVSVSGGQLQRLAVARALVAGPDVLVLDEALSQLDAATARMVRERLTAQRPGFTVVEITHRADLVPDKAPVIVLDGGRLLEAGAAGQLRQAGGAFTRLEARN